MTNNELHDRLNEAMDALIEAFNEENVLKKNLLIQDAELSILEIKSRLLLEGMKELAEKLK